MNGRLIATYTHLEMMDFHSTMKSGSNKIETASDTTMRPEQTKASRSFSGRRWRVHAPLVAHLWFFLLYAGGFIYAVQDMVRHRKEAGLIYSPARGAVEYELRAIESPDTPSAFAGLPSKETDAAWQALLRYNNLVLQKQDLIQLDKTSVPLRDGSGYLAGLGVMHQLHCLNHVREYAFPDYYIQETGGDRDIHVYHCIDNLRQNIMCHADITPRTYEWSDGGQYPAMKPTSRRQCRKWEPIHAFTKKNRPSVTHSAILENPTLGLIEPTHHNASQAQ